MAWLKLLRRPKSLRWRYSLRALFVFITLFMLWGGYHTNRGIHERRSEAILLRRGATLGYLHDERGVPTTLSSKWWGKAGSIWGERCITSVEIESLLDGELADAICSLPYLTDLSVKSPSGLRSPTRSEGQLARVLADCEVTSLTINGCDFADADFNAIARETCIQSLDLSETNITEEALARIIILPSLNNIYFNDCRATGKLLAREGSDSFLMISCSGTPVVAEFGAFVRRSPKVSILLMHHESIDDVLIQTLDGHPGLEMILISDSTLTASCVESFARIPRLRSLMVSSSSASPETWTALQKARPDVRVN